jgi:hypothetical protein
VRYNTLMVITHLVLNDMIKVKGQVSHVAQSLNDPNEAICELARLFFIKLSERSNNPVYNLLGDIISIFSQADQKKAPSASDASSSSSASSSQDQVQDQVQGEVVATASASDSVAIPVLSKEQFQSTMHFLLSFVLKDKYVSSLYCIALHCMCCWFVVVFRRFCCDVLCML